MMDKGIIVNNSDEKWGLSRQIKSEKPPHIYLIEKLKIGILITSMFLGIILCTLLMLAWQY